MRLTSFSGRRLAAARPRNTTGTSAISIPSVVPATTGMSAWYLAARATVASCVLSPISIRKNEITVVP